MASWYKDTVSNICQNISDLRGESTADVSAKRIRAVSRAEQDVASRRFWKINLVRNATATGDGTSDYTIGSATFPMREKGLAEVFVGGLTEDKRFTVVDFHKFQNLVNQNSAETVAYEYYDQTNDAWKVHINSSPDASITIYYSYYFLPPDRTTTTDVVYAPNLEAVVRGALAQIYEGEEELVKAQNCKNDVEQLISEATGHDNAPAINQLYTMGASQNQIRPRGFGSY